MLFVQMQAALTVQESFADKSIRHYSKDGEDTFPLISNLIHATSLALNVGKNLNSFQAYDIAVTIINDYKDVKISELVYIFKQGKKGLYGPHYNKFDIETVVNWINGYFSSEEYNNFLENRHRKPIERVELTDEQKQNWTKTLSAFKNAMPENNTIESKIGSMSVEQLRAIKSEYENIGYAEGSAMIESEIVKRK